MHSILCREEKKPISFLAEDDDHRSETGNNSRLRLSSALSGPSSALSMLPPTGPILKRPKTASTSAARQKSAVSFASVLNTNDSDTEQAASAKRIPKYKDFIRQLPIYLAKSILSMVDQRSLEMCKLVSTYWKKMAFEVEDEALMTRMLYDDMMLLQVKFLHLFFYSPFKTSGKDRRKPSIQLHIV